MSLIECLGPLANAPIYIVYRLAPKPGSPKLDKVPVDIANPQYPADAQAPSNWMTAPAALAIAQAFGPDYGVGIVIADGSGLFAIDIDDCLEPNGQWSAWAVYVCNRFPGAYVEVSVSGKALHVLARHNGTIPAHGTRHAATKTEVYSKLRFIALTGAGWNGGNINSDHTAALAAFLAEYFPPRPQGDASAEWTTEPVPQWSGPADDAELLQRALRSYGAAAIFGTKASFADLWEANTDKLSQAFPPQSSTWPWDRSAADMALAAHLAFWTGSDCERMARLMRASKLARDKWEREDYFHGTVLRAVATQKQWYNDGKSAVPEAATTSTVAVPVAHDGGTQPQYARIDRSAQGNANLLVQLAGGNLRHVHETKQWLRWSGARWQVDTHEVFVTGHALDVAEHYLQRAAAMGLAQQNADGTVELAEDVRKWAVKSRSRGAIDDMITLARKVPGVPVSVNDLDRDPWLLGVDNGVVDLRSGELREIEAREDYVTKRCAIRYSPGAKAQRWETAIAEITGSPVPVERDSNGQVIPGTVGRFTPRPELALYLQKALGYSITGTTREQKFFLAIGKGSNGKGLIFDTVMELLGPYALAMPSELFIATKHAHDAERPTALAASLAGVRLVVSSETKDGQQLDIGVIKNHTGDKKLTARRMRQDPVTFDITHKPWLLTNVQPKIEHLDAAIRGRLHLVPFDRRWNRPGESDRNPVLPDGDKTLMTYLRQHEAEGILAWLVRGALLYQQEGLTPPREVTESTRNYMLEQDHLSCWLGMMERCSPKQGVRASELYQQFTQWCVAEGRPAEPNNQTAFGRALDNREIESKRLTAGVFYGLRQRWRRCASGGLRSGIPAAWGCAHSSAATEPECRVKGSVAIIYIAAIRKYRSRRN